MTSIFEWAKAHKVVIVIIFLVVTVVFCLSLLIVNVLFKFSTSYGWLSAEWKAGEALGYFGMFLTFVGTMALGGLVALQNKKAHDMDIMLQTIQCSLTANAQNEKEVDTIKDAARKVILSFDIHVFDYIIHNIDTMNYESLYNEVYNARKNAYNSSIYFDLLKYFKECSTNCKGCSDEKCELSKTSDLFKTKLNNVKGYYEKYIKDYLSVADNCLEILYKRNWSHIKYNYISKALNDAQKVLNDSLKLMNDLNNEYWSGFNFGQNNNEFRHFNENFQSISQTINNNNIYIDKQRKSIDDMQKTPDYSNEEMIKDIGELKCNVCKINGEKFYKLKEIIYLYIKQVELEYKTERDSMQESKSK